MAGIVNTPALLLPRGTTQAEITDAVADGIENATSQVLPSGASTSANQATANTALAAIQAATAQTAFGINDVETPSATVTYVGKSDKDGNWLVQRIDTSSGVAIGWASVTNNGGYLTYSAAWAARASLTYGRYDEAF